MNICILTHTFPRNKKDNISSIFMAEIAQSLVNAGNKVWVLTPFTPGFVKQKRDYKIVTYKYIFNDSWHKLGYSETLSNDMGLPIVMWLLSPFMYFFGFIALLRLIKKEKIDVVNAHWILPNGFIACAAALFANVKVVSTLPGSDVYMAQKNILFNLLARFATWRSNWITSNSNQLIKDLEKCTDINLKNKSSNIIYGAGSSKFVPDNNARKRTRKELGFKDGDIVVLGVGRLVAKKGFRYLIKAAYDISKKYKNVFYVLIGDGEERNFLESIVKRFGLENKFKFLGNMPFEIMNNYYNMSDIFILPSVRDEKGNLDDQSVAVIDAMSCARPVVTTDFPGYRKVIKNGEIGFLIPERKSKLIAETLIKLIKNRKLRDQIGKEARKATLKELSWNAIGKEYTVLFRSL